MTENSFLWRQFEILIENQVSITKHEAAMSIAMTRDLSVFFVPDIS